MYTSGGALSAVARDYSAYPASRKGHTTMLDQDADLDLLYQTEIADPDWYKTNIPCQVGCPAHTDVSNYIGLISQGRFDEAYVLNRHSNVVPGVLGRTCARPCEPVCRRNKIDGQQVSICWLKRAAARPP